MNNSIAIQTVLSAETAALAKYKASKDAEGRAVWAEEMMVLAWFADSLISSGPAAAFARASENETGQRDMIPGAVWDYCRTQWANDKNA